MTRNPPRQNHPRKNDEAQAIAKNQFLVPVMKKTPEETQSEISDEKRDPKEKEEDSQCGYHCGMNLDPRTSQA